MFNKNIKIIILGTAILLLSAILIFVFNSKGKNVQDEVSAKLFEELKNNHPEFSVAQLEFYRETAKKNEAIILPCEERNDENDCVASVAFLKGRTDICGHIENQEVKNKCANEILKIMAAEKIDKCWLFDDGHSSAINCLMNVFTVYNKPGDCLSIIFQETRQVCESLFYYEIAFLGSNIELCQKVIDDKLNQYCIKNINTIDKSLDSDNDGLTDYEEKNIYKTDPHKNDTDEDGYSDGIEVKSGNNPLGK